MDGTVWVGGPTPRLDEMERELAALEEAKAELQRESRMFRRLGFSTERIRLRLCQVDARRARYAQEVRRLKAEQQRKAATCAGS